MFTPAADDVGDLCVRSVGFTLLDSLKLDTANNSERIESKFEVALREREDAGLSENSLYLYSLNSFRSCEKILG